MIAVVTQKLCGCPKLIACSCDGRARGYKSFVRLSKVLCVTKPNREARRKKQR